MVDVGGDWSIGSRVGIILLSGGLKVAVLATVKGSALVVCGVDVFTVVHEKFDSSSRGVGESIVESTGVGMASKSGVRGSR
jgi:hypothetical protein